MRDDRTVHATTTGGCQIVRYDRAGKWYIECPHPHATRRRLSFSEAVTIAAQQGAATYPGLPGGQQFDRALERYPFRARQRP